MGPARSEREYSNKDPPIYVPVKNGRVLPCETVPLTKGAVSECHWRRSKRWITYSRNKFADELLHWRRVENSYAIEVWVRKSAKLKLSYIVNAVKAIGWTRRDTKRLVGDISRLRNVKHYDTPKPSWQFLRALLIGIPEPTRAKYSLKVTLIAFRSAERLSIDCAGERTLKSHH